MHRLRRWDGEYRWHRVRAEPLRDHEGHIIQWYGFSIDIDEAKKAEEQLRRSEANLAEAQKLSRTGSWALSPSTTKIFYWSEECYRIWGFDPAQGVPNRETVWRRIHPGDRDRMYEETKKHCGRKEITRSISESCSPMGQSNISKQLGIIGSPRMESLSR